MEQAFEVILDNIRRAALEQGVIDALYIPLQGKHTTNHEEEPFDLADKILSFFVFDDTSKHDPKVMLLMGDAGSGKSMFSQQLHQQLWKEYKTGDPIPLWIPLSELQNPFEGAVEEVLIKYECSESQIAEMKATEKFIFVVDGYDELHQFQNCYVTNGWNKWHAKILITCRSQALYYQKDPDKYFMPFNGDKRLPMLYRRLYIAPFSKKQISSYIKTYLQLNTEDKISEDDTAKVPGLTELITTPFLLHLAVESLSTILANQENNQKMTQAKLYDVFIERWFTRQVAKLRTAGHLKESEEDTKKQFWDYCKSLALQMHVKHVSVIPYKGQKVGGRLFGKREQTNIWEHFFNEGTEVLRSACPLRRFGEYYYGFLHASMIEYFATRAMYEEIQDDEFIAHNSVIASKARQSSEMIGFPGSLRFTRDDEDEILRDNADSVLRDDRDVSAAAIDQPRGGIHQRVFALERRSIQFLADRIEMSDKFKQNMLRVLEASKKSKHYAVGAANAITALIRAGVAFNGKNLSGIKISGADISGGYFDHADLSKAELCHTQMFHVWLSGANFEKSQLEGVNFGEYPWFKHNNEVRIFDFREDLKRLVATTTSSKKITIWNSETGEQLSTLEGHEEDVTCVQFSPDGKQIISGSLDKTARIWWLFNDGRVQVLRKHTRKVNCVAFSPDGGQVVTGSDDGTMRIWDVKSEKTIILLRGHKDSVTSVSFSPNGKSVVSGSLDRTVRIWDITNSTALFILRGHEKNIWSVAFSKGGERVVSGSSDKTLRIWNVANGEEIALLRGHEGEVWSVSFSPNGEHVMSGSSDKTVRLWEVASGTIVALLRGHSENVNCVQFSFDGERVFSGSHDKMVRMWDVMSGRFPARISGHGRHVTSIALSPDGNWAVSGSAENTVRIWNLSNGNIVETKQVDVKSVICVKFSLDSKRVLWGGDDLTVRAWDVASGKTVTEQWGKQNFVHCIAFSSDGERVASGVWRYDDLVWIGDFKSGKELHELKGHEEKVTYVVFSPNGERVASGSCDKTVRIWEVTSGIPILVLEGHEHDVNCVKFSEDGLRLASGSKDKTVRVWDVLSKKPTVVLEGHEHPINSVTFSFDGQRVVSGSDDKTVRIWDIVNAQCLVVLKLHDIIMEIQINSSDTLIVGFSDGSLECWQNIGDRYDNNWQLHWSTDIDSRALSVEGLIAENAIGLSDQNRRMLEQRGAIVAAKASLITQVARRSGSPLHQLLGEEHDEKVSALISKESIK